MRVLFLATVITFATCYGSCAQTVNSDIQQQMIYDNAADEQMHHEEEERNNWELRSQIDEMRRERDADRLAQTIEDANK